MLPLSFTQFLFENSNLGFKENNVGYLYNTKEQQYLNCANEANAYSVRLTLTSIPSAPWTVKKKPKTQNFIFLCDNKRALDIAWKNYITIHREHGKHNQQFKVDIVSSNKLDEIVLQENTKRKKQKRCFTAKLGKVSLENCKKPATTQTAQVWYWIPERLVKEMIFKPMIELLEQ
ncbi:hypothetical protein CDIK_0820 [Cucumispora dikerogammari]|nr:hypothetical protein CDIK_0820 [Cucumispora dikerogammari]